VGHRQHIKFGVEVFEADLSPFDEAQVDDRLPNGQTLGDGVLGYLRGRLVSQSRG
jgi:hypothetical protein